MSRYTNWCVRERWEGPGRRCGSTTSYRGAREGVAANSALRQALERFCAEAGLPMVAPPPKLCTDNGAMIAWAGVERLRLGLTDPLDVAARPRWPLDAKSQRTLNNKA